jgi:cytochrome c553
MNLKTIVLISTIILLIVIYFVHNSTGSADMNAGAEKIIIQGGTRGNIAFNHRSHQNNLGDCDICHSYFPQETGSISNLKNTGQLKKKQLMKKLCIKCHKTERMADNPYGPTTYSKCHIR